MNQTILPPVMGHSRADWLFYPGMVTGMGEEKL